MEKLTTTVGESRRFFCFQNKSGCNMNRSVLSAVLLTNMIRMDKIVSNDTEEGEQLGESKHMDIISKEKKTCLSCMEEHEVSVVQVQEETVFKGITVKYTAVYEYCDRTEEFTATEEMIDKNDTAMKNAYRMATGLLTSDDIIGIREKYKISQTDLCTLLDWGKKTITRYEGHQVQDAAHDKILRKIESDPEWFLSLLANARKAFSASTYKKYYDNALQLFQESKDLYLNKAVNAQYACCESREEFMLENRAGAKSVLLNGYDKETELELLRREERRETEAEVNERVAKDMLLDKFPLESIKKISRLSEAHIRKLAKSLGVAVL
jgi:putative zinc finger/helix-turn-helix YgiT family protein